MNLRGQHFYFWRICICTILISPFVFYCSESYAFEWKGKLILTIKDFQSDDPELRRMAVQNFSQLESSEVTKYLLKGLWDKNVFVVVESIAVIEKKGINEAIPFVLMLLERDTEEVVRVGVLSCLASFRQEYLRSFIQRSLGDPRPRIRISAIRGLVKGGYDDVLSVIITMCSDSNDDVAIEAIKALGNLGDKRALIPLIELSQSPYQPIQYAALQSLSKIKDPSVSSNLIRLLEVSPPLTVEKIIQIFSEINDPRFTLELVSFLWALNDFRLTWKAIYTLGELADPVAVEVLIELLIQGRHDFLVIHALKNLGPQCIPYVLKVLKSSTNKRVISSLLEILELFPTSEVIDFVMTQGASNLLKMESVLRIMATSSEPEVLHVVISLFPSLEPDFQAVIIDVFLRSPSPCVSESLLEYFPTITSPILRSKVLLLLAKLEEPRVVSFLCDEIIDLVALEETEFVLELIPALGYFSIRKSRLMLLSLLAQNKRSIRWEAALAIGQSEDPDYFSELLNISDLSTHVGRGEAILAMAELSRYHRNLDVVDFGLRALEQSDPLIIREVIELIEVLKPEGSIPLLVNLYPLLGSQDQATLIRILGNFGTDDFLIIQEVLDICFTSRFAEVLGACAWTAGQIGSVVHVDRLFELLRDSRFPVSINSSAALGVLVVPSNLVKLQEVSNHPDPYTRANIRWAIASLGVQKSSEELRDQIRVEMDPFLRASLYYVLYLGKDSFSKQNLDYFLERESDERIRRHVFSWSGIGVSDNMENWIFLRLNDSNGVLVSDEPVVLLLPNGRLAGFKSDKRGWLRFEEVNPGTVYPCFPKGIYVEY